jgi:Putative zinc-finger
MAERTHIPNSPACGHWETLLADALDGLLTPADEITFREHMTGCTACSALYEEAQRGREWLEFLSAEPEIPEGLVARILAQTSADNGPGKTLHGALATGGPVAGPAIVTPSWQRPGFMGFVRRFAEPRLMMTAAMAFFSLALTLNLTGIRLTQIRLSDLRPTAVRSYMERRIAMASVPISRYYDHLRFVYELQSRMRELRGEDEESQPQPNPQSGPQQSAPGQPAAPGESERNKKDGGSHVDPRQEPGEPAQANEDEYGDYLEASESLDDSGSLENLSTNREVAGNNVLGIELLAIRRSGSEGYLSSDSFSALFSARLNTIEQRHFPAAILSAAHPVRYSTRAFRRLQNKEAAIHEGSRQWTALTTQA